MGTLIDTSILIELERNPRAEGPSWQQFREVQPAISVITVSELLHGVHRAVDPLRRKVRQNWVDWVLDRVPVLPFDLPVAHVHSFLWAQLAAKGLTIGRHDLIIAATAVHHGMDLLTRNRAEFARIESLQLRDV